MHIKFFILGMIFFLAAQVLRAVRWQFLLPQGEKLSKRHMVSYVSLGSFLNTFLPFHLGDFLRAILLSRKESIKFSFSIISVLIERITDIFIVGLIVFLTKLFFDVSLIFPLWILFIPIFIFIIFICIKSSEIFRLGIYKFALLWNANIKFYILDIFWTIQLQLKHAKFLTGKYFLLSLFMWALYLSAYINFFYSFDRVSFDNVWLMFHGDSANGVFLNAFNVEESKIVIYSFEVFVLIPTALTIAIAYLSERFSIKKFDFLLNRLSESTSFSRHGLPSIFHGRSAYENFLSSYFSNTKNMINKLGISGFDDCKVSRVFSGGSGAITALIEKNGILGIRKLVPNNLESKLLDQYLWLSTSKNLPVVEVLGWSKTSSFSFYEMPYNLGAVDMYDWLHSVNLDRAKVLLLDILSTITNHHNDNLSFVSKGDLILDEYLNDKVICNVQEIKQYVSILLNLDKFQINSEDFSMDEWSFLEDKEFLSSIIKDRVQTDIHGDLTIENMIVNADNSWFLIDPNPSTKYKTRLMDWGKVLQSLHKGYERVNKGVEFELNENGIKFLAPRSDLYHHLHISLLNELESKLGLDSIIEAELHEIIHYLRLLPYKFTSNDPGAFIFFAITCQLIREFKLKHGIY